MRSWNLREEILRLARFGAVGAIATAIYYGLGLVLNLNDWHPQVANVVAYCCANLFSFLGHFHFTFKVSGKAASRMVKFALLGVLGYVISTAITAVSFEMLDLPAWIALALVVVSVTAVTWTASRFWIFKQDH